jgi:signal recognition particle subunit SRP19
MPSIEEVFDDDTDYPLPSAPAQGAASGNYLRNTGTQGALLEEISDQDVDAIADAAGTYDMDMDRVAEQGKGFGDNVGRPATSETRSSASNSASMPSSDLRPSGDRAPQQGPMGGIMGDFLKMQQAEEERMKKLEKQLGAGMVMKDQQEYKS